VALVPRAMTEMLAQVRRDVVMVSRRIAGKRSPLFTSRRPNPTAARRIDDAAARLTALLAPRTLRIARVVRETPDAVTLELEDPLGAPIRFVPGQFFTLILRVGEEVLRRAYSASSDARETDRVAVTVKRVAGGIVSNQVNDHAREGELLQVLGPSGSFSAPASSGAARHLVFVAGGSGMTPLMSIARSLLAAEPGTRITLVYGNRAEKDVIFRDAIDELARAHGARLAVRYVLSEPPEGWKGGVGMLEEHVVRAELDACGLLDDAHFLLCGPEPMMRASRAVLRARGVPEGRILEERFTMPHLRAKTAAALDAGPQLLTIRANGARAREVYVAPEQTMLEAGLSSGIRMDYSCAMGGCGACKVRLCDGEVEMEEPNCLTSLEREAGYVLACVSRVRKSATIALDADAFASMEP
jgi:ring-1,2-phenylacetyl-CoA epoxidase subunit PaaE